MVAITRSENLNPQHFKRVRVLQPKNTAPAVKATENTFEAGDVKETEYVMVPVSAVDKLQGYVPIDRLTAQKILEQAPATQLRETIQDHLQARENDGTDIGPNVAKAEIVPPVIQKVCEKAGSDLIPVSSVDQLVGYELKFALLEDGKDYSEAE